MSKANFKKSLTVCTMELSRWFGSSKMILLLLPAVFVKQTVLDTYKSMSLEMGAHSNLLEAFIAVLNNKGIALLIICFYLFLLSDFMKGSGLLKNVIYCAGRRNWIRGQLEFIFCSSGIYLLFWLFFCSILSISYGDISNKWSRVVTDYVSMFPQNADSFGAGLIEGSLFRQMSPCLAACHSFLLNWMYLILLGELIALFFVLHLRKYGVAAAALLVAAGTGAALAFGKWKWLFPAAHTGLAQHFTDYFRKEIFPLKYSYLLGMVLVILFAVMIYRLAGGISFSDVEDERNY
ncbi:MAG: hypothetical protein HDR14_01900 [Lachnospiraceae bacterium]|nr:hypothetical protein [Lachnospiraceae bacterium]